MIQVSQVVFVSYLVFVSLNHVVIHILFVFQTGSLTDNTVCKSKTWDILPTYLILSD